MRRQLGNIRKRGNNFEVKVAVGKDSTGKYHYQTATVRGSPKEAAEKLSELWNQAHNGTLAMPGSMKVGDFLNKWLLDYCKANLSPKTYERYEGIVRTHLNPAIGNVPLSKLRANHIQSHYATLTERGLAPRSVKYDHVVIHKALNTAIKWGLVNLNAADGVDVPKAHRTEMQTWDENELNQFLEAAKNTPYHALFYTCLFTGMRRSELLALRWSDVDLDLGQVSISRGMHHLKDGSYVFTEPKSQRSRRTISLTPSNSLLLRRHRDNLRMDYAMLDKALDDNTLIFSNLGVPLRPNSVSRAWAMLAVKAKVKVIRFHDARHSHASIMLQKGISPKIIQERLGHSSIAVTMDIYSHVTPGMQTDAAARFDEVLTSKV